MVQTIVVRGETVGSPSICIFLLSMIVSFFMILKKMRADFLTKYVVFVLFNSFFYFAFFHEKSALWVTLICAIGLIMNTNFPRVKKTVLIVMSGILIGLWCVPLSSGEFDTYLSDSWGIQCLGSECVEVAKVDSKNAVELQKYESFIHNYTFDWYFVFAVGEIELNNKSIKAINIMGLWIPLNSFT